MIGCSIFIIECGMFLALSINRISLNVFSLMLAGRVCIILCTNFVVEFDMDFCSCCY